MFRIHRLRFIAILILTAAAVAVVSPFPGKPRILAEFGLRRGIDLAGGAELRYRVLFEADFRGDRKRAATQISDVLRRRLDAKLLTDAKVHVRGDDEILVQIPGVDAEGLSEVQKLIGTAGKLELFATAPPAAQGEFERTGIAPSGCKVVTDRRGAAYLVDEKSVVEGSHLVNAEPRQDPSSGSLRWATFFELDAEGARLFDEAAERLYLERPRGRIVIVLDGRVQSAPQVESPAFHGRGQIYGHSD